MTPATTIALLLLSRVPPSVEIAAVAAWYGVDPALAIAVADAETGNVPESRRDSILSRTGDVGRMQVNVGTWHRTLGYRSPSAAARALRNRHTNIVAGVRILASFQARFGGLTSCRCGGEHLGGWVAHYNGGNRVEPGSRGERYALRVAALANGQEVP